MRANDQRLCLRCGGVMRPGKAILNTCTGIPDFQGQEIVTLSPGGPGIMVDCLKCCQCGQSRLPGEGDTPHCPQHGPMQKANPATQEQKWCGEWWRCDRCTRFGYDPETQRPVRDGQQDTHYLNGLTRIFDGVWKDEWEFDAPRWMCVPLYWRKMRIDDVKVADDSSAIQLSLF